jgi:hypothetical protein
VNSIAECGSERRISANTAAFRGNKAVVEPGTAGATEKSSSEEARSARKFGWDAGDDEVTEESSSA